MLRATRCGDSVGGPADAQPSSEQARTTVLVLSNTIPVYVCVRVLVCLRVCVCVCARVLCYAQIRHTQLY